MPAVGQSASVCQPIGPLVPYTRTAPAASPWLRRGFPYSSVVIRPQYLEFTLWLQIESRVDNEEWRRRIVYAPIGPLPAEYNARRRAERLRVPAYRTVGAIHANGARRIAMASQRFPILKRRNIAPLARFPSRWHRPDLSTDEPAWEQRRHICRHAERLPTSRLSDDGIEVHEPGSKDGARHGFQRPVHAPVERDFVIKGTERSPNLPLLGHRRHHERDCRQDCRIQVRHRRADRAPHNPVPRFRVAQEIGRELRIEHSISKVNSEAAGAAEPAVLVGGNQGAAPNITAAAVHYVAGPQLMTLQSCGLMWRDAGDSLFSDAVFANVDRHHNRHAHRRVVGGMQLAAEGSGLNEPTRPRANLAKRETGPITARLAAQRASPRAATLLRIADSNSLASANCSSNSATNRGIFSSNGSSSSSLSADPTYRPGVSA